MRLTWDQGDTKVEKKKTCYLLADLITTNGMFSRASFLAC